MKDIIRNIFVSWNNLKVKKRERETEKGKEDGKREEKAIEVERRDVQKKVGMKREHGGQ